jgi:hypothetical protein
MLALVVLAPLRAQYAGPAILARGQAPAAMSTTQIDFRPFLTIGATYDTGLNGVSIDANGNPTSAGSLGVDATAGVSGLHSWKHTTLGLTYTAAFRHYTRQSYYDGTDQYLLLGLTHMLSRHWMFSLRENAGLYSQNFSLPGLQQTVPFDPSTTYVPTNDFFDNRTMYFSTQADLTVQLSTRLSFNFGADGFMTRRRSTALYGVSGAGARGDFQYRVSRRTTMGAAYDYTHYSYTGIFSSTDMHMGALTFATRLTRSLEFSGTGGVTFYETKFVRTVPIDPVITAITGIASVQEVAYSISHIPTFSARLSQTVHRGVFFLSGGRSVIPGNGLFLTSTASAVDGGYAYTGLKHWAINGGVSYSFANSFGNVVGAYSALTVTTSISRQIFPYTHGLISFNLRRYTSGDFHNYNQMAYSVRLGLGFTPGDIPIRLW